MEARSKTELLQRETKFERAISWACSKPALIAASFYFIVFMFAFACSRPPRHSPEIADTATISSPLHGLWLLGFLCGCTVIRKFVVLVIRLNQNLMSKIVLEQNWLRTCFAKIVYEQLGPRYLCEYFGIRIPWDCWDHMYGRNLWDEWDQHYLTNSFLIYLFCIFNMKIFVMYVTFFLFNMWYKGKGDQGGRVVTPSSTCKSRSRQRARDRSHGDASLECV
jgi:hypothetical protein